MTPTVSVVMPVYNAADHVGVAIDSILAQSFADFELIIVDDGSSDGTGDVLARRGGDDPRIRLFHIERTSKDYTTARARNLGIAHATGRYYAAQDADDIAVPHRLETQIAFLQARDLDVVGGQLDVFGAKDSHYWFPESHDAIAAELSFRPALFETTKFAKMEVLRAIPYPKGSIEDYAWLVKGFAAGLRMGSVPEAMARHRVWPGQISQRAPKHQRDAYRKYRFEHVFAHFPGMDLAGFMAIDTLVSKRGFTDESELRAIAKWLVQMARIPEPKFRERIEHHWRGACDRATFTVPDAMRERIDAAIADAST